MRPILLILTILASLATCSEIKSETSEITEIESAKTSQPNSSSYSLRLINDGKGPIRSLKFRSLSGHEKRMENLRKLLEKAQEEKEEQGAKEKN